MAHMSWNIKMEFPSGTCLTFVWPKRYESALISVMPARIFSQAFFGCIRAPFGTAFGFKMAYRCFHSKI